MKVGFVILTLNSERVIKACLESVIGITSVDSHIVVVDNGSTDTTKEIISSVILKDNTTLKLICHDKDMGISVSRNDGIKYIRKFDPEYYCILDSDTVISESALNILIDEMNTHKEYGLIGPKMATSSGVVQMSARSFPTFFEKICKGIPLSSIQKIGERIENQAREEVNAISCEVDYIMGACWLIRPTALDQVGGWDEKIFYGPDDAEYCIRMWKNGYSVAYCEKAQIIHEWQRLSKRKLFSKVNLEHIKGLLYMFKKHSYFFSTKRLKKSFPLLNREGKIR
ncbi:MAG: glycosyltransferase family 2 protein [Bacteroides sp.]|nr:glycosyltransferase family 2 protein [Eubacterium sp.]MCM1419069.1 glycosyltransferase family 2 protein [Roseburia sp.]MCM1461744.1 glycosyltransferase family 2 protein [Bacteroides sp.]